MSNELRRLLRTTNRKILWRNRPRYT